MTAALDLSQRHFSREIGPVTLIGTWVATDEGVVPCLAIIRRGEEFSEHTVPCVVTLNHAFVFAKSAHEQYPHLAWQAVTMGRSFAQSLRLESDRHAPQQIIELIEDHIEHLFRIPPYTPPELTSEEAVAEVTITDRNTGKRVREVMV
jgi:hypothetical protein